MRGRTFKNAFIIADEMQNCSPNQMLMLLTRLGDNSKIIITGDLKQCDKDWSGLKDLLEKLNLYYSNEKEKMKEDGIGIIEFTNLDVQRSELVSKILKIYNQ
jgi:phosphate starvation-inducible PhoH-like protein